MKLYTEKDGLVADINNKLYERLRSQYNFLVVITEENLLTQEEYQEYQDSKIIKLDIDYFNVSKITVDVSWQYNINGAGVQLTWFDKNDKEIDVADLTEDHELNDFHERITESCGNDGISLLDISKYLDMELIKKYNITIHDEQEDNIIVKDMNYEFTIYESSDT